MPLVCDRSSLSLAKHKLGAGIPSATGKEQPDLGNDSTPEVSSVDI